MVTAARRLFTPGEYLAIERAADHRSQYYCGEIYAMAGASLQHVTIVTNVNVGLATQLNGRPYISFATDLRVKVAESGLITYPDVIVACPPLDFADEKPDTLLNPRVLVEVLSDSTES